MLAACAPLRYFVARRRAHSDGFSLLDSDAPLSRDDRQIEYVKVNRPIWPLDENTRPRLISRLIF